MPAADVPWVGMTVAGAAVVWALAVWSALNESPRFIDLMVYRAGGQAWLNGIPLYGPQFPALVEPIPLPFTYPPIAAVLFVPLTVLPFPSAAVLLTAVGLICLALVGGLTAHRLEADRGCAALLAMAVVVLGTMTEPVQETLFFGQVNLLLMGLVVADCLLPRTPWPRGMLIGVAAAIKLTPAVFVLFFLGHRRWRPVLVAGGSFVVATALGFFTAPTDSVTYWYGGVLTDPSRIGSPGYAANQSMAGLLYRWSLPAPWHTAIWLLAVVAVLGIGWVTARRLRARGQDVAALLAVAAAGLLASPVSWSHHYVWVVPALIWCAHRALRSPRWWPAPVVLATVVFLGPHWLVATPQEHFPRWDIGEQLIGNAYVWICLLSLLAAVLVGGTQRRVRIRVTPTVTVDSSTQPTAVSRPATQDDAPEVLHSPS